MCAPPPLSGDWARQWVEGASIHDEITSGMVDDQLLLLGTEHVSNHGLVHAFIKSVKGQHPSVHLSDHFNNVWNRNTTMLNCYNSLIKSNHDCVANKTKVSQPNNTNR